MEDFGDILFYIIAAIIGLVTTIGRKKRKNARNPIPSAPESADSQSYESVIETGDPELDYQVEDEDFRIKEVLNEQVEEVAAGAEKIFSFDQDREGHYKEPMAEQFVNEGKQQFDVEEEMPEEENIEESVGEEDLVSDFDLKKAVIFSEILNRKDY